MLILAIGGPYASAPVNAPTSLSGIVTDTTVAISFTAPTNDGGAAITNYEYSTNGSTWTALSPADATSPVTVSGLSANTSYTIYLRAVNIVGSGPSSTGLSITTNKSAPSTVSYLLIAGGGTGGQGSNPGAYNGGGGGGGGGSYSPSVSVSKGTSYTITVGGSASPSSAFTATVNGGVSGNGGAGGTGSTANGGTAYTGGNGGPGFFFYSGSPPQPGYTPPALSGTSTTYGAGGPVGAGGGGGANTGNGGGGGDGVYSQPGVPGGTGLVIIRYSNSFATAASTTGTVSYSSAQSGYHTYTFTGSGSITW